MSDQPLTLAALVEFHREVIAPQFKTLTEGQERTNARLDAMDGHFDAIFNRFLRLEQEYEFVRLGLGRVEHELAEVKQKLDRVEQRLDGVERRLDALERRLAVLEVRLEAVEAALRRSEERMSRVEKRVDELAAASGHGLFSDVRDLKIRVDDLQAEIGTLRKRLEQP